MLVDLKRCQTDFQTEDQNKLDTRDREHSVSMTSWRKEAYRKVNGTTETSV